MRKKKGDPPAESESYMKWNFSKRVLIQMKGENILPEGVLTVDQNLRKNIEEIDICNAICTYLAISILSNGQVYGNLIITG